jgi:ethanolamine ammonia-lyase small subunit
MTEKPVTRLPWERLREFTGARIALGRSGSSLPTAEVLAFELAHAQAKDAVHAELDGAQFRAGLEQQTSLPVLSVRSRAETAPIYLTRPDLGRQLHPDDAHVLQVHAGTFDIAITVAAGLSAVAVTRHALPLLGALLPLLHGYTLAPLIVAERARVALADAVGQGLGAKLSLILIGERPGLSTPESLGAYLTYAPRVGRLDAERNCISNIHGSGLSYRAAAHGLSLLIREALRQGQTGIGLKVEGGLETLSDDAKNLPG